MKMKRKAGWALLAGVCVAGLGAWPAAGQYPSNNDGRALDASNRVGSGGINSGATSPVPGQVPGNRVVTGNVTDLRSFRGGVPYTDPRELRAPVGGDLTDQFIKNSAGVPAAHQRGIIGSPEVFYGRSLAVPPPANFQEQGFTQTYVRPPMPSASPQDLRLQSLAESPQARLPVPDQMMLPGPIDPATNQPTLLTGSPLYGVRQWNPADAADRSFLLNHTGLRPDGAWDRLKLDPRAIQKMRDELAKAVNGEEENPSRPGNTLSLSQPLPQPFESPAAAILRGKPLENSLEGAPLAGTVRPEQRDYVRLLSPPTQQSSQYAELRKRLERYYTDRMKTDEDLHREVNRQLRLKEEAEKAAEAKQPKPPSREPEQPPASQPAGLEKFGIPEYARLSREIMAKRESRNDPDSPDYALQPRATKPQPLRVGSLSTGVKGAGLGKVLRDAEQSMRDGKFVDALDQYDAAEQVAPNNPLIWLGRSHAELGACYYGRAEAHLRQALLADPTLLMGQYDLQNMIGDERLAYLVKDLKGLATDNPRQARPVLLLAYIAYNTGNERQASAYLNLAQQRSDGQDSFYQLLREHWSLPPDMTGMNPATQPGQ